MTAKKIAAPQTEAKVDKTAKIWSVPVSLITTGDNDRKNFNEVALSDLAASIEADGLLQPITLRPISGDGAKYEIVAGERRFRAVCLLCWDTIPAIIRELDDEAASAAMLVENTGRVDLNPIEQAKGFSARIDRFSWSVERVASASGMTVETVKKRLALLTLDPDIQHLVGTGNISLGHAESMTKLDAYRQKMALRIFTDGGNPSLSAFRQICSRLGEEQSQDSLIDLSTFYVEQLQEQAAATASETPRMGKAAKTGAPTRADLPAFVTKGKDTVATAMERYIGQLLEAGLQLEAETLGTFYEGLVHGNFFAVPAKSAFR